ncbi:hypothetical protein H0H92_003267, partial [Tricholoma furcatifolium]
MVSVRFRLKQSEIAEDVPLPPPSYTPKPGPTRFRAVAKLPKLPKLALIGHGKTLQQPS